MSPLGDSFPEGFKNRFAQTNLKVGSVIKAFVTDTNPPTIVSATVLSSTTLDVLFNEDLEPSTSQIAVGKACSSC